MAADAELLQGVRLGAEAEKEDNLELHLAAGTKVTKQRLGHLTHRFHLRTPPRDLTHLAQTLQTCNRIQNRKLQLPRLRTTSTTASATSPMAPTTTPRNQRPVTLLPLEKKLHEGRTGEQYLPMFGPS